MDKKIGDIVYIGHRNPYHQSIDPNGVFVKYCPKCHSTITITKEEAKEMYSLQPEVRNGIIDKVRDCVKTWFKIPNIEIKWHSIGEKKDLEVLERIEVFCNKEMHAFNTELFNKKYGGVGGIKKLEEMVESYFRHEIKQKVIASYFGFSKQNASKIIKFYKSRIITKKVDLSTEHN